jgi:hypothetical protein
VGTGALTAAAVVWVVSALLIVLVDNVCAAGTEIDSVTVADGSGALATVSVTSVEFGVVEALTVTAEGVEFDSGLVVFEVVCSDVGAVGSVVSTGTDGWLDVGGTSTTLVSSGDSGLAGVGGADSSASVVLVCAPPLLPMVTPVATSVLDDVLPDVCEVPVAVVPLVASPPVALPPVDVDPPLADVEAVPVADSDVSSDPVALGVELAELVEDESEDVSVVSALATPGEVTTMTPIPRAAANAPTRPMYPPSLATP